MSKDTVEFNGKEGVWRTVMGRHIFIADGEDLGTAMKNSGKFKGESFKGGSRTERNKSLYEKLAKKVKGNKKPTKKDYEKELDRYALVQTKMDQEWKENKKNEFMEKYGKTEEQLALDIHDAYKRTNEERLWGSVRKEKYIKEELAKQGQKYKRESINDEKQDSLQTKANNVVSSLVKNKIENNSFDEEYELYKKAKENPDSIGPMTENSTDWESLDKKYSEKYNDELARISGGVISTLQTKVPQSKADRLKVGTEIYYKGDQANTPGYFTIESFDPSKEQFMTSITLKEKGGEGRTKKIGAQQIEDKYVNNYASRFSFKEDYDNFRNQVYEHYKEKYGKDSAGNSVGKSTTTEIKHFPTPQEASENLEKARQEQIVQQKAWDKQVSNVKRALAKKTKEKLGKVEGTDNLVSYAKRHGLNPKDANTLKQYLAVSRKYKKK